MALNRKKLQKKKAKRVSKNKDRKALLKKKNIGVKNTSDNMLMKQALKYPIYQCWRAKYLFESDSGVGTVIITRKSQDNDVVLAVFLLDVFCLGVKNAFISIMFEKDYLSQLDQVRVNEELEQISAPSARKLIEDAEKYANELGFSPHKDYHSAKKIFGDIDTETCSESFEFGREGKPYYMAGPYDSQSFSKKVIKQLMEKCGPDEFNYFLPMGDSFLK
jgi:hypothetical protein